MLNYIAKRVLQALPVLFLSSVFVFLFIRLIPRDTAMVMAGANATPEQVTAFRVPFGTDKPLATQYMRWMGRLAHGDLGISYVGKRPIAQLVVQRLPATLHLAIGAMLIITIVGGSLEIFCAVRPRHPLSKFIALFSALALATPTFWLGILLVLFFSVKLR